MCEKLDMMLHRLGIYSIEDDYSIIKYEDTEHYQVMKSFINNPRGMLNYLLEED